MKNTDISTNAPAQNSGSEKKGLRERTVPATTHGLRILVAEDHPTNRLVFERQLTRLGYSVDIVPDGKVALSAIQDNHYDLILTDCHMPEMDGFELTAQVRRLDDSEKARIPIVAVTANALSGDADRCISAGMNDYLTKPVSLEDMSSTLLKWLSGENTAHVPLQDTDAADSSDTNDFDKSVLEDLVGTDDEIILSLLDSFMANAQVLLVELNKASSGKQEEAFESAAHMLSGSAKTAGAKCVAKTIDTIRDAAKESDWTMVEGALPQLEAAVARVENTIDGMRP